MMVSEADGLCSYLIYFPHFPLEPKCFKSMMGWTWLPSATFELPFLPRCTHTNMHRSPRRPPAVNGKRWSSWFACLPCQVMGHIPQDPEKSVRLAHPPLTPPLKDGEINWVCACGRLCVCRNAFYYQLCVYTYGLCAVRRSEGSGWSSDFRHKTLSVTLITAQPADGNGCSTQWLLLPLSVCIYTHMQNTPTNTQYSPLWSSNVCLWLQFFLCLAASVNWSWKPLLFLGEKNESL